MINFSIEPEFQQKLNSMQPCVREECEPLDYVWPGPCFVYDSNHQSSRQHIKPLQAKVREMGLWACHLGPHFTVRSRWG